MSLNRFKGHVSQFFVAFFVFYGCVVLAVKECLRHGWEELDVECCACVSCHLI